MRDEILAKIKAAGVRKKALPPLSPVQPKIKGDIEKHFIREAQATGAEVKHLTDLDREVAFVSACFGIAETGTLVFTGKRAEIADIFLREELDVLLKKKNILSYQEQLWEALNIAGKNIPSSVILMSGPSRTGDIEQKIHIGAHGPKKITIFLD